MFQIPVDHIFLRSQDIGKQQFIAIPVHIQRFVDRYFHAGPAVSPQIHQNFVFDTAGCIRRKFNLLFRIEGIDCLDQSDGSDRDQIFHSHTGVIKLLCDIDDKAQIVFNQTCPRLLAVFFCQTLYHCGFLLGR